MTILIGILDPGISNVGSLRNALSYLAVPHRTVLEPAGLEMCSHIIIPGDGSFPYGMARLRATKLDEATCKRVLAGTPILGICLGMQLLAEEGDEFERTSGLGLCRGRVTRMRPKDRDLRLPQIGWNDVSFRRPSQLTAGLADHEPFYFMQSYAYDDPSSSAVSGVCDYGGPVVAMLEQGHIFGVQFHPEKSQRAGLQILRNFAALRPI